jgi:hypothetical protein
MNDHRRFQPFRCSVLLLATLAGLAAPARAELRFAQTAVDAGEVRRGPALVERFDFVNAGATPIDVVDVKASCGCLRPRFSQSHVAPGEKGWVELDINTLSQPAGPNSWRIQVASRFITATAARTPRRWCSSAPGSSPRSTLSRQR